MARFRPVEIRKEKKKNSHLERFPPFCIYFFFIFSAKSSTHTDIFTSPIIHSFMTIVLYLYLNECLQLLYQYNTKKNNSISNNNDDCMSENVKKNFSMVVFLTTFTSRISCQSVSPTMYIIHTFNHFAHLAYLLYIMLLRGVHSRFHASLLFLLL